MSCNTEKLDDTIFLLIAITTATKSKTKKNNPATPSKQQETLVKKPATPVKKTATPAKKNSYSSEEETCHASQTFSKQTGFQETKRQGTYRMLLYPEYWV